MMTPCLRNTYSEAKTLKKQYDKNLDLMRQIVTSNIKYKEVCKKIKEKLGEEYWMVFHPHSFEFEIYTSENCIPKDTLCTFSKNNIAFSWITEEDTHRFITEIHEALKKEFYQ